MWNQGRVFPHALASDDENSTDESSDDTSSDEEI